MPKGALMSGFEKSLPIAPNAEKGAGYSFASMSGMKGWRERAADIFAKHGEIAAKMKPAPGPGTTDFRLLHHSPPHQRGPVRQVKLG